MSLVIYHPLYPCDIALLARPYEMFFGDVRLDLEMIPHVHFRKAPRFLPVPEGAALEQLRAISREMYPK